MKTKSIRVSWNTANEKKASKVLFGIIKGERFCFFQLTVANNSHLLWFVFYKAKSWKENLRHFLTESIKGKTALLLTRFALRQLLLLSVLIGSLDYLFL